MWENLKPTVWRTFSWSLNYCCCCCRCCCWRCCLYLSAPRPVFKPSPTSWRTSPRSARRWSTTKASPVQHKPLIREHRRVNFTSRIVKCPVKLPYSTHNIFSELRVLMLCCLFCLFYADKSGPTVLPVPVPVFVPVPMNMYSQYTPKPVGLPIPVHKTPLRLLAKHCIFY